MVLGLAMFATAASAQINGDVLVGNDQGLRKSFTQRVEQPTVDYKASIFTKARGNNVGDTLEQGYWDFNTMTGITYGQNGVIGANDSITIQDPTQNYAWVKQPIYQHNVSGDAGLLMRITDTAAIRANATTYSSAIGLSLNTIISVLNNRLMKQNFMFIMPSATAAQSGIRHDCYVGFPAITNPNPNANYEIRLTQCLYKFYDGNFIDFKVGNEWYTREINVEGVDAGANEWAPVRIGYTMPIEFGQQSTLQIRIRFYNEYMPANVDPTLFTYGYFWGFDNIAIVRKSGAHWFAQTENYVDGGYGTIPVGMNIPLAWYGEVYNDGTETINGATATVSHIAPNGTKTTVTSKVAATMNPSAVVSHRLSINERSWYDSINTPGFFGWSRNYNDTTNSITLPNTYTRRGLPTTAVGLNRITVTGVAGSGYDTLKFDTIGYNVVDNSGGQGTNLIEGYRLAHDNGIIMSGSSYQFGHSDATHVTDVSPYYNQAGYQVIARYTTPDEIPTDPVTGEPWVIRGIEIVPRTDTTASAIIGSVIQPLIYACSFTDSSDGHQYYGWRYKGSDFTGLGDDYTYTVTANDINTTLNNNGTGVIAPGENYNAINIKYFAQPELLPNTAYYIGYRLAQTGYFAVARHLYGYTDAAGDVVRYNNDPELAPYYRQFTPLSSDVLVEDLSVVFAGGGRNPYWPMIRMIVGPREEAAQVSINGVCSDTDTNFVVAAYVDGRLTEICDASIEPYEGSDATVYVIPTGDSSSLHPGIIDAIIIDGQRIAVTDEDNFETEDYIITESPYNVTNNGNVLLPRSYYIVTFTQVDDDHTVSAEGHPYPFNLGIEGEAVNVSLGLKPNPATNSVTLNMRGVEGMVNCSIIDMSGRVVYNRTINAENAQTIDLSNVAAGAYFVRVTNDSFSKVEKLIVR